MTLASALAGSTIYTVNYQTVGADEVQDVRGNDLVGPATTGFTSGVADTTAPISQDIRVVTNGNFNLDSGDVFTVAFNEVMAAPAAGATIRLTDADGTVADVICGLATATCTRNAAAVTIGGVSYPTNQVITVSLLANPTIITVGTTANLQLPATVTGSLLITDTAGNNWDIPGSPDKILN